MNPNSPHGITQKAINEFKNGNIENALSYFEEALNIKPDYIIALQYRGICRFLLSQSANDTNKAIEDLEAVVKFLEKAAPALSELQYLRSLF